MKRLLALVAAISAIALWVPIVAQAQQGGGGGGGGGGRGNFDPAQMRQRMMDRYKEALAPKDDTEWSAIEPRIQKVLDARRDVGFGGGMRFGGQRRGGGGAGGAGGGDTQSTDQPRRNNFAPQQSQAAQDLQKALDSGASKEQIKTKLEAYRDDRKTKQEKLDQAQADLKKILTLKQEAAAVLAGLID